MVVLQGPELTGADPARIRAALLRLRGRAAGAGREEKLTTGSACCRADVDDDTDAAERYEELDDLSFDDLDDEWDDELADADHEAVRELRDLTDNDLVVDQGFDEDDEQ